MNKRKKSVIILIMAIVVTLGTITMVGCANNKKCHVCGKTFNNKYLVSKCLDCYLQGK